MNIYVSNGGSQTIQVFRMGRFKALEPVQEIAVPGEAPPGNLSLPIAVSPNRRYLYAAVRTPGFPVSSFAIEPGTGRLSPLGTAHLVDSMCAIATDRSGRYLLSASYGGSVVSVNTIDPLGLVREPALQVLPTPPKAHCVRIDRDNRFAYAASLGGDQILHYRFDAARGRLTPASPPSIATAQGAGPRHLAFHPQWPFLYMVGELNGTLGAYRIDVASGALAEITTLGILPAGFAGTPSAADIHLTPDGRFLYTSERASNTLAGFRIDPSTGKPSPIGHWATEKHPRGFAIDPAGGHLAAAGMHADRLAVYAIDQATGALTQTASVPTGHLPNWVEIIEPAADASPV
ncbi:MAG: lactonase family protein [Alphaproteobacteria bacterium]|nr:lactonase family protein [Alphaproteobacteria bacterium]